MNKLKAKLAQVAKNKDARTLASNFVWLSVLKIIGYVFPLITLPYLSRVIGVDGFGEIAFALSVVVLIETFTDFGFNYTATRDIARNREDISTVSKIFSNVFWAKTLLMTVGFIVLCILILLIPQFYDNRLILFLTFLYIPGHILFPEWLFQAFERMKYITILNLVSKAVFTILVFIVIKEKSDYILQPLLTAIGYVISGCIAMYYVIKKIGINISKPCLKEIISTIKGSFNMFVTLIFPNLYTQLPISFLRVTHGEQSVGFYTSGERFYAIINQLFTVLSRVFYPFLSRRLDQHRVYELISGIGSLLSVCLLYFGSTLFVQLFYTPEFSEAIVVIKILSISPIAYFFLNTYGTNYLVIIGKERVYKNVTIIFSVLGLIMAVLLINKYSYIGFTIALVLTRFFNGITVFILARIYKHKNKTNV